MMKRYYIAYGSNLNKRQMKFRCPGSKPVGVSFIEGYRLLFKGSQSGAYLTIEKCQGKRVPVAIWEIDEEDERSLDRYEGYPSFYYKKGFNLEVETEDGKKELDCFAYIMDEKRALSVPSQYYVIVCCEGYDDFGFDRRYLYEAYEYTKANRKPLWEELKLWEPKQKKN